jgi:hypothetical protein
MNLAELLKKLPDSGLQGEALREAAAGDFRDIHRLVYDALKLHMGKRDQDYIDIVAMFADQVVVRVGSRLFSHAYTLNDKNEVELGDATEVVKQFALVGGNDQIREALPTAEFIEAAADAVEGKVWKVCVIESGLSGNGFFYPPALLREAAPMFEGVPVFAKSDIEHLKGQGKDVNKVIGWISSPRFVEAAGGRPGRIVGTMNLLASATKLREALVDAWNRGKKDLMGLSIDALGAARMGRRDGRLVRMAESFHKINSVDLIIEPGAGGRLIRLVESINPQEDEDMKLRESMLRLLEAQRPDLYKKIDKENITDEQLETTFREAMTPQKEASETPAGVTQAELKETIRMVEARSYAATTIGACNLPDKAKDKLRSQFGPEVNFTEAQVDDAIKTEREYLASFVESGKVDMGDLGVEVGENNGSAAKILDDFFDLAKPTMSFREAYVMITGDRGITGLTQNCDMRRMREALAGEVQFIEAISAATFGNALGSSITRAMIREYNAAENYRDFRDLVDIVPVTDFRTQERTRVGGYGNLPAVAENGPYNALTTPSDEKATYAISKRGGTETISIETIANDDVGLIMRIPRKLGVAAARTLYEFVLDFLATNANIYDGTALFTVGHGNLGTVALGATSFAARRLAMKQQTELSSAKKLGLIARHLYVPAELEETAYDLFVRTTNNDESFVQSRKPKVHVVDYWTDANNWYLTADKSETPLIELGFYNGNEEPEVFVQDNPTQGSLFSNDQLKYKIRHIYSGAVEDFRGFDGNVVV